MDGGWRSREEARTGRKRRSIAGKFLTDAPFFSEQKKLTKKFIFSLKCRLGGGTEDSGLGRKGTEDGGRGGVDEDGAGDERDGG